MNVASGAVSRMVANAAAGPLSQGASSIGQEPLSVGSIKAMKAQYRYNREVVGEMTAQYMLYRALVAGDVQLTHDLCYQFQEEGVNLLAMDQEYRTELEGKQRAGSVKGFWPNSWGPNLDDAGVDATDFDKKMDKLRDHVFSAFHRNPKLTLEQAEGYFIGLAMNAWKNKSRLPEEEVLFDGWDDYATLGNWSSCERCGIVDVGNNTSVASAGGGSVVTSGGIANVGNSSRRGGQCGIFLRGNLCCSGHWQ